MDAPQVAGVWTPSVVIFDYDGTLADSYAGITASVNHVRARHDLPPLTEAEVRPFVGYGPGRLLQNTVPVGKPEINQTWYRIHHPSVMFTGSRLLPGVAEALARLKEAGMRMAVCSNKPAIFTQQLLDFLGISPFIDAVLGPEDVPQAKPAPDMLQEALMRLGAIPEETLYVGDMTVDIETARAAGVTVWVVPTGSQTPDKLMAGQPDRMLKDFDELAALLTADRRPPEEPTQIVFD